MPAIDAKTPHFTSVLFLDLRQPDVESVVALLGDRAEQLTRTSPGFLSCSILQRRSPAPAPVLNGASERLLEYVQWESPAAYSRWAESGGSVAHHLGMSRITGHSRLETYELDAVISAAGRLAISAKDPHLTLVVRMDPHAGKQRLVNDFNQDETREFFATFDGFVGAGFHLSGSGAVLEYLKWESIEAMESATSTEHFRTHVGVNEMHCHTTDFGVYDVLRTTAPDASPAVAPPTVPQAPSFRSSHTQGVRK